VRRRDRGPAQLLIEGGGLGLGGGAQLLGQDAPARLVLGQGRTALAAPHQQPHQRPVRLFAPRLQRQHAPGMGDPRGCIPAADGHPQRPEQRPNVQLAQALPLPAQPVLERGRITDHEPGQQLPLQQCQSPLKRVRVRGGVASLQGGSGSLHVEPVGPGAVEGHGLARD
jgi:hypothetical protein